MNGFACECFLCGGEFTADLPRVFCDPCRPIAAARAAEIHEETLVQLALAGCPMPGDRVRLRTDEDRAFERDVTTDLAAL